MAQPTPPSSHPPDQPTHMQRLSRATSEEQVDTDLEMHSSAPPSTQVTNMRQRVFSEASDDELTGDTRPVSSHVQTLPQGLDVADLKAKLPYVVGGLALGIVASGLPLGFSEGDWEAQKCLGVLVVAAVWWLTEPFPPYVTALSVALLIVVLQVMRVPGPDSSALVPASQCPHAAHFLSSSDGSGHTGWVPVPMKSSAAAQVVAEAFFDPVILLFISGFAMGGALDKFQITERLAKRVLGFCLHRPSLLLLVVIWLCCAVSMALSNVAAAVLLTAVVTPLARNAAHRQPNFAKQLILGVAYGCNVGGMTTPIASPQNVIALVSLRMNARMPMSFIEWCSFSFPFSLIASLAIWASLQMLYKDSDTPTTRALAIAPPVSPGGGTSIRPFSSTDWFVSGVVVLTVFMWCIFDLLKPLFGHIGVVGLLPVVVFHGLGLLGSEDWHKMPWSVLTLLGGGVALGNAVESSGLLAFLAKRISADLEGSSVWVASCVFYVAICIVANFLSSTVCAIIALPVVAKVGASLGHPKMFVVGCAVMTSAAMGLPVSSFPNANAATVTLSANSRVTFVQNGDFIRSGFRIAALLLLLMCTVGQVQFHLMGW